MQWATRAANQLVPGGGSAAAACLKSTNPVRLWKLTGDVFALPSFSAPFNLALQTRRVSGSVECVRWGAL